MEDRELKKGGVNNDRSEEKCRVTYKGHTVDGYIVDKKLDKFKVIFLPKGKTDPQTDWFEKNVVHRIWN